MYAVTIALNHKEIGKNPDRISEKLISHIRKDNWNYIDFPASIPDYKIFEKKNNEDIALNILYTNPDEQIRPEYISKYNFDRKNQVTLLKITDGNGTWHILSLKSEPTEDGYMKPIKSFSQLMRNKSSKLHEHFYCYGCFHSFRCQSTLEKHTLLCKDHDYCKIKLTKEGKNIKKHKYGTKALRMNNMIYLDLECLLLKYYSCSNSPNQSHTKNDAYHEACGYSKTVIRNHIKETTTNYHRGKDSLSKLCKEIREKATDLFNTKKLSMTPLTRKEQKENDNSKECFICKNKFIYNKKNKYYKNLMSVMDHDHYTGKYRGAAHSVCNLRYKTQEDIPVVIHNGSNYDFHLIITELAKGFRSEIHCIPEDKEKYKTFSIPIMRREVNNKNIKYNLRFIDSARFMMGSLDTHVNNLSGLYDCNCADKKKQQIKIEYNDKLVCTRCKTCPKRSKQTIKSLKDKFPTTYQLTKGNIDKFIFSLRKGVYPYEYMDSWERFKETELPPIDKFYSKLNLKDIKKDDYRHAQRIWPTFNIKNLGEYHDLYVQSDTVQLADIFEQFRTLCLKEYELDPAYFCTTPGLAMETCLKMTNVKIELLADIDMVLMFEKGLRGGISQAIHRYATANNKYMPNYDSQQLSLFSMYLDANNLYGWAMCKKLPLNGFLWVKNLSQYTSDFIKNYNENSDLGYLLEVDVNYPKHLHELHRDLPFLPVKKNKLLTTLEDKKNYVVHIYALKQALNHGLELEKMHRVIKFRQLIYRIQNIATDLFITRTYR